MKKRRRIEITAFRRRTTVILRDRPEGRPIETPPLHVDASLTAPAGSPQLEGAEAQTCSGHAAPAEQLESLEDQSEVVTRKRVGRPS